MKLIGNRTMTHTFRIKPADCVNIVRRQFRFVVSLAARHCAVVMFVLSVLQFGSPCQVEAAVIGPDAVQMSGLHPDWTRPNERLENNSMDKQNLLPAIEMSGESQIAAATRSLFEQSPLAGQIGRGPVPHSETANSAFRPYRTIAANAVAWEPWNLSILNGNIVAGHDRSYGYGQGRPMSTNIGRSAILADVV